MHKDRQEALNEYKRGNKKLRQALADYPNEMWQYKSASDHWSIHERLIHLANSELVGFARLRKIVAENGATILTFDDEKWAGELSYHNVDVIRTLDLFELLRDLNLQLLASTSEVVWNTHAVVHPEGGAFTLDDWLQFYAGNTTRHLYEMQMTYEHWLEHT